MNKRGISNIIATLLIVLLVIVVSSIVWVVVRNFVQESSDAISLTQFTTSVDIESAAIEGGNMGVKVKRSAGKGTYLGTKFIFSDGENSVVLEDRNNPLDELEERTFSFTPAQLTAAGININDITEVSVAPIIETEAGNEAIGQVTGTRKIGNAGGGTPTGGTCGDGIRQNQNEDDPSIDEVCDGLDISPENTCITEGFPDGGELFCAADCLGFDTSQCTEAAGGCTDGEIQLCPNQIGVCELSEQICAGGLWPGCVYTSIPGYEETESLCVDGLDNDCNGLFDSQEDICELTFLGTVEDPWPAATKLFFVILEQTPDFISLDHGGRFIEFTSGGELNSCIKIFDYVTPEESAFGSDKSIVKLEEILSPFAIATGDTFTIYEKTQCGTPLPS